MANDEMMRKLKAMQALYGAKLPERLADLDRALQACRDAPQEREPVETLHRLLHTMAGAAGTFGYDSLGADARGYEQQVKSWLEAGAWSERDLDRIALLLPQLQAHLARQPMSIVEAPAAGQPGPSGQADGGRHG